MAVAAALLVGAAVGVLVALLLTSRRAAAGAATPPVRPVDPAPPMLARRVLEVMGTAAVVLDPADEVVLANPAARQMGVVRGGRVVVDDLRRLARAARRDGEARHGVVDTRGRLGREPIAVSARVAPLVESGYVALLLDDVTETRRLEAVRRDFVANVSHELKTPVGALTLLAEAVQDAADDPEAIRRFAGRMQHEGTRLGRLVAELIELSRLQGAEPLPAATVVDVDDVVAEAVDRTRLAAESAGIVVVSGGQGRLAVRGNESQLVTALVQPHRQRDRVQPGGEPGRGRHPGPGRERRDLGQRPGHRHRRARTWSGSSSGSTASDPARSRATGGTGLGLAIVKHVATNHGGGVSVWSVEGSGSTFTLRLPVAGPGPLEPVDEPTASPGPEPDRDHHEEEPVAAETVRAGARVPDERGDQ